MVICEENALSILQQLVRIRTHQPQGDEADLLDYIFTLFPFEKVQTYKIDHGKNRASLVAAFPGENEDKTVALIGQMDTHGLSNTDKWAYPPYRATFRNGYVYGRGTSNMKGGLTSIILTLQELLATGEKLPVNILLCLTADGELNGSGAQAMINGHFLDRATELIFVEPTNCKIAIAQKGALWIKLSIKGKTCMTCFPENGTDALEHFMTLYAELRRHITQQAEPHPLIGYPICILTKVNGQGAAPNFIADRAEGIIDIRSLPYQDNEDVISYLHELAQKAIREAPGLEIDIEILVDRQACTMPEDAPLVQQFQHILKKLSMNTSLAGLHSFSDVSRIVPKLGLPFIIFGPGEDIVETSINEKVSLISVVDAAKALTEYIRSL